MSEADIAALRKAVLEDRYIISLHAQERMGLRKITHADLKYVVTVGDVVEQYPDNRPDPKALFMAHVQDEPLCLRRQPRIHRDCPSLRPGEMG